MTFGTMLLDFISGFVSLYVHPIVAALIGWLTDYLQWMLNVSATVPAP